MQAEKRQTSAQIHGTSALLGAALVLLGFAVGKLSNADTNASQAVAQDYTSVGTSFFRSGNPAIMTQSADGKTIYFWGLNNQKETLEERKAPRYAASVSTE